MRRRVFVAGAVVAAGAAGLVSIRREEPLEFRPWPPVPSLRMLPAGAATGAALFAGLDDDADPPQALTGDLCPALFGRVSADTVPVAYFTDHYCPNCRRMAATLADARGVAITRHEFPVLGDASEIAARAALAADRQDARERFHERMRRTAFQPTPAYLRDVARSLDLDVDRFMADLEAPQLAARLADTRKLARRLGITAVPTTIVGRTVVVGDISAGELGRLVRRERQEAPPCPIPAA